MSMTKIACIFFQSLNPCSVDFDEHPEDITLHGKQNRLPLLSEQHIQFLACCLFVCFRTCVK